MAEKIVKDSQSLAKDLANDCISRSGVSAWLANRGYRGLANKVMDEDRFPSAQPKSYREGYQAGFKDAQSERKRGKWEMLQMPISPPVYKCSVCGSHALQSMTGCLMNRHYEANLTNYCPYCGADMREVDDERPD